MNFTGVVIGAGAFLAIGLFHVLVVKAEYHFGVKTWPLFCLLGIVCIVGSLFLDNIIIAALLCIT
jgi:Na+/H+ antiporter NhaD/arsenite permease-like protein